METRYGCPIVTADTVFNVVAGLGIVPWPETRPLMDLREYLTSDLTPEERAEAERFAPRTEVTFLQDPRSGKPFIGYRSRGKNWATTFILLPNDLLVVTVEWKHGAEVLCLVPPSGVPSKADLATDDPMAACAMREAEEESGFKLKTIHPLSTQGIGMSPRKSTERFSPFLGELTDPVVRGQSRLDTSEHLKIVLFPLAEWMRLIDQGMVWDDCAISTTLLALRRLKHPALGQYFQ